MTKTDCFAYTGRTCTALDDLYCQTGNCNFGKTREQLHKDQEAAQRLNRKKGGKLYAKTTA